MERVHVSTLKSKFYSSFITKKLENILLVENVEESAIQKIRVHVTEYDSDYDYTSTSNIPNNFYIIISFQDSLEDLVELVRSKTFKIAKTQPFSDEAVKEINIICRKAADIILQVYRTKGS